MRYFTFILFSALTYSVFAQPNQITKIEFQSTSRTYFEQITITPYHSIITQKLNREAKATTQKQIITSDNWSKLINKLEKTSPKQWPKLVSPSQKRTYDGARHSQLVAYTTTTSYTHLFDDLQPNTELCNLLSLILEIRDSSKK
ncbi:hypothetical protein N7E81_13825 [Reichenbachiella carrageenanivorans]|uniref:Secreted protein n=1 Tax=Reichenbachiella carrageenanivorans TaxID=2979869 RepID=A0ABY6CWY3_9BACT|nr:hypothetical protein [Reichenbachiella carrageenanivorans]UXX78436.1 hypothetical protein N7E81_13825 [Reichenbachiella carrageenanivorans]